MDVFEEILARLDVEDVLRCKSVCKSWYSLISTDYFVKAHLKQQNRNHNSNREHGDLRIQLHRNIDYTPTTDKFPYVMMVGSSDGLVCLSPYDGAILVTNPSIREVKELPTLPYEGRSKLCWGFGYDSSTDDYKAVVGFNESDHHMVFQVLSFKSNKWKFVGENLAYNTHHFDKSGFLYNGALHWFLDDIKNNNKKVIICFDLSTEKFNEIPQPDDKKYVWNGRNRLGTFEECLCIFHTLDTNINFCQTWVMKNYNSWQLLPRDYENNKYAAATTACRLDCIPYSNTWCLCNENQKGNVHLFSRCWHHIAAPIFVKSLVSPYMPGGKSKNEKNNKRKVDSDVISSSFPFNKRKRQPHKQKNVKLIKGDLSRTKG